MYPCVMKILGDNLKFLRKKAGLTQQQLAERVGIKRPAMASYEEGRSEPRLNVLRAFAGFFNVKIDELLEKDLALNAPASDTEGRTLRVLPVAVDHSNKEQATIVPEKASAGYLKGFADAEYISGLPVFSMPFDELRRQGTIRVFQISGDSMLPIPSGAYLICSYEQDWNSIRNNEPYVILTMDEGLVFKRVFNQIKQSRDLLLVSDNPAYKPYSLPLEQVKEIWRVRGFISFEMPESSQEISNLPQLKELIAELKAVIAEMRH